MGTVIVLLVVGLIVGAVARAVLPGRQTLPIWLTMIIGAGSLLLAGLVIPGHRTILELIVGVVIAAAIIAVSQGGVRAKSTSRI